MAIRDCNEYRTRNNRARLAICPVCENGLCRYPSGELSVANTDLDGNTPRDPSEGTLPPEITRLPRIENKHDLLDATAYGIAAVDFGREIFPAKASPPTPKLVVHAIAMERIDAGNIIRVETDLKTGMTYARKA